MAPLPLNWKSFEAWTFLANSVLAVAAIIGGLFGYKTLRQIKRQAELMKGQWDTLEKQIVLQFRPKLVARNFIPIGNSVMVTITNTGGTRARYIFCRLICDIRHGEIDFIETRDAILQADRPHGGALQPGAMDIIYIPMSQAVQMAMARDVERIARVPDGPLVRRVFCAGTVRYIDDVGTERDVNIMRWFDERKGKFAPSDDPEVDYAD